MALTDLLPKQVDVYANTRVATGSGGRKDSWAKLGTVGGQYYVRAVRSGGAEKIEGGGVTDPGIYDFALDVTALEPATEHVLGCDGRWFQIDTIQVQGTVAFVRAREREALTLA